MDRRVIAALTSGNASARLQAALEIGSNPDPALVDTLLGQCATESDFYVRDMLTWALTHLPPDVTVPKLLVELSSECAQSRSQALHTLSKIRDARAWPAITPSLLHDPDDEVARSAWRAAVVLVPNGNELGLAQELATQLGRGDRNVQLSLSRALAALGEDNVGPALQRAMTSNEPGVRAHARAAARLLNEPDAGSLPALAEAKRIFALGEDR